MDGILAVKYQTFSRSIHLIVPKMLSTSIRRLRTQFITRNARKFSSVPTEGSSSGSAEIWDWVPPSTAKIQPLNDLKNYVLPVIEG